jgi:hypothetical protein
VHAAYSGGSGTTALTFIHQVPAGQNDANGISVGADAIALNGGAIRNAAGTPASLTHAAVASNPGYLVDTSAPVAGEAALSNFIDTGSSGSDFVSSDNSFDLVLTGAEVGSSVAYEVSTDGGGNWSPTAAGQTGLADGSYRYRAVVSDRAGNIAFANEVAVTVDSTPPSVTAAVDAIVDDVGAVQGTVARGGVTDDASLSLRGTLGAPLADGETLRVYDGGAFLGSATVAAGSTLWTFDDARTLTQGQQVAYTVRMADAAGNEGAAGAAYGATIDLRAPLPSATVTGLYDNYMARRGPVARGGRTDDPTPALSGSLSAELSQGQQVRVYAGEQDLGVATVSGTTWRFTPDDTFIEPLRGTSVTYSARVVDASGRRSDVGAGDDFLVRFVSANGDTMPGSRSPQGPGKGGDAVFSAIGEDEGARLTFSAVYVGGDSGSMVEYVGDGAANALTSTPAQAAGIDSPSSGTLRSFEALTAVTAAEVLELPGQNLFNVDDNAAVADALKQLVARNGQAGGPAPGADTGWLHHDTVLGSGLADQTWTDPLQRAQLLIAPNLSVIGGA